MNISEFGSYIFGKKWIYHRIPYAMRVLKMSISSKLEILKVRTTQGTLRFFKKCSKYVNDSLQNLTIEELTY